MNWVKWQPSLVFLPGESHGHRSLAGYSPWACKESHTTEAAGHTSMHTEYEMNTQKSFAFLYTNKERPEIEIKETIPFIISSKRIPRNIST